MKRAWPIATATLILPFVLAAWTSAGDQGAPPAKERIAGPGGLALLVRMQGPYDADVPLQVVCYFRHKEGGNTTKGAAIELDRRLGGAIATLRERGDFAGDALETLVLETEGKIEAKRLLLIGLGDEGSLALEQMVWVGRTAYREAAKLGATRVAFAPLIRDQGNEVLPAGEVARHVVRGLLRAREADVRLQRQGLAKSFALEEWIEEAGPKFYEETVAGVRRGLAEAKASAEVGTSDPGRGGGK